MRSPAWCRCICDASRWQRDASLAKEEVEDEDEGMDGEEVGKAKEEDGDASKLLVLWVLLRVVAGTGCLRLRLRLWVCRCWYVCSHMTRLLDCVRGTDSTSFQ